MTSSASTQHRLTCLVRLGIAVVLASILFGSAAAPVGAAPRSDRPGPLHLGDLTALIGADAFWAAGHTGDGIDIAVIDTGIAPVPALLGDDKVVVGPDLSFDASIEELYGLDGHGHGTHVAGIIAAKSPGADPLDPQPGDIIGVAPDARIVSVKVGDNTGAVDVSQVIAAIDWVVQHRSADGLNIRVINLSYNTTGMQDPAIDPLAKAIENAWNQGIVVVNSAGNEGRGSVGLALPATSEHLIAVASGQQKANGKWDLTWWSPNGDRQRHPDLVAPGRSIASLRVPGSRIDIENPSAAVGEQLFLGSGTSQSAAAISGAAALLLDQRPMSTPDEIKALLLATSTDLGRHPRFQGAGLVDLRTALDAQTPIDAPIPSAVTGLGSLDASRGTDRVVVDGEIVAGERIVTGQTWDPQAWIAANAAGRAWSDGLWLNSLSGTSWSGTSWSGTSWSGTSWSGTSWSGTSWSGTSWSGTSWSGTSWSGTSWSGTSWSGDSWS